MDFLIENLYHKFLMHQYCLCSCSSHKSYTSHFIVISLFLIVSHCIVMTHIWQIWLFILSSYISRMYRLIHLDGRLVRYGLVWWRVCWIKHNSLSPSTGTYCFCVFKEEQGQMTQNLPLSVTGIWKHVQCMFNDRSKPFLLALQVEMN